jgi:hypothetical protein
LVHFLECWYENCHELHDDRGRNIWTNTEHDYRKIRESATRKDVEQTEELVVGEKRSKLAGVYARYRNSGEQTKYHQCAEHKQYASAQYFVLENKANLPEESFHHRPMLPYLPPFR